ncbi:hypothetical protein L2088_00330 [Pseudomonas protegens]|uniref:hypothetical protein n=1 Tax=Pseudomonas protegens TaxID=380021 RepID=UPI0020256621|nr:hypothetical protein [Pseudomonas protegens]MCL9653136.1 hypothetical protein [Pseudomonas protegens]
MENFDLQFLNARLRSFIDASINRVAHRGFMSYDFQISAEEIRQATGRQRMTQQLIQGYVGFFSRYNVFAEYDSTYASFSVTVDLNVCTLSHDQAQYLSVAMETYRAEVN